MKGCDAFSVRHINHFLQFFLAWFMSLSFVTSCGTPFLIFAIVVESSSIIIVAMRAFSVVLETNISTAKSLYIAFEIPPPIHPTIMLLHPICYFIHLTLFAITNSRSITQDLLTSSPYQNTVPWSAVICFTRSTTPSSLAALLYKLHKFCSNSVASRQDFFSNFFYCYSYFSFPLFQCSCTNWWYF